MTCSEVQSALADAVRTGKLGTPVAARVHVQLVDDAVEPDAVLAPVLEMLRPCFDHPPASVRAREHASEGQWNVLFQTAAGGTVFVTVGCGAANAPGLHLLVIGNHGVLRLEGAECFRPGDLSAAAPAPQAWSAAITESLRSGRSIDI